MPKTLSTNLAQVVVDLASRFAEIQHEPGAVWLDSATQVNGWGRRSLVAHQPVGELKLTGPQMYLRIRERTLTKPAAIENALLELDRLTARPDIYAVGFISHEATLPLLGLRPRAESQLPLLHFYLYDSVQSTNHVSRPRPAQSPAVSRSEATLEETLSQEDYTNSVISIKNHIREGDIYQANFTCRFDVRSQSRPFHVYWRLRTLNPATYAAYLNFGEYQILSVSPERMLFRDGELLSTSPVKGTIKRGQDFHEDQHNIQELLASEKDRAEHLMIVDLERNDLGKIAKIGSVSVENLFRPELHSSLIHLVSDISARIDADLPMSRIFTALLPGGSITGAPKRRAVEIISDTEVVPRSVYTGYVGYIHGCRADFNIAIRTIIHHHGLYYVHAGGGIVADSEPALEYQEMLLKASNLFRALGIPEEQQKCLSK